MYPDTQCLNDHEGSERGQLEMGSLEVKHECGSEAGQTVRESRASDSLILRPRSTSHPGHRAMHSTSTNAYYSTPAASSERTCQVVTVECENEASTSHDQALPLSYSTNPIIASSAMSCQDACQDPSQHCPLSPESSINPDISEFLDIPDTHDTNTTGMEPQLSSGDTSTGSLYVPMQARPLMSYAEHQRSINSRSGQLIDFDWSFLDIDADCVQCRN